MKLRKSSYDRWCKQVNALDRYQKADLAQTNNPRHDCTLCGMGMYSWVDCAVDELEMIEREEETR